MVKGTSRVLPLHKITMGPAGERFYDTFIIRYAVAHLKRRGRRDTDSECGFLPFRDNGKAITS